MAVRRDQPYPGMNFLVDIGDGTDGPDAGVQEVVFPEARLHVVEYRTGNAPENDVRKIHTLSKYTNLTLRRGALGSLNWYNWWNEVRNGAQNTARSVTITLLSEDRSQIVLAWRFLRARPVNFQFSALNALAPEVLTESLELAFERIEME